MRIHGYRFLFDTSIPTAGRAAVSVRATGERLRTAFPVRRPPVPLSGSTGIYRAKSPFEEAGSDFSWALEIVGEVILAWEPKRRTVTYEPLENFCPKRLRFWLYHTFFPMSLEFNRSTSFLHVGAVAHKGEALLFAAPSFGGKSTLTAHFLHKGHALVCDDAAGITRSCGRWHITPSYPWHRPYRQPATLGKRARSFASEPLPVRRIYLLEKAQPDAEVSFSVLRGIERFRALNGSIFIDFPFRKRERLAYFGAMANDVEIVTLHIPWDLERLDEVYTRIIAREKGGGSPAT